MPRPFPEFSKQFFWDFKRMDNVNYNFEIVELLYAAKRETGSNRRFNKPIIILIMAIIECSIYDFIIRINEYSQDSFPNITQTVVSFFRGKKETDELRRLIPLIESQNLFRVPSGDSLYTDLEHLRKVRNRVHIQNKFSTLQQDEAKVFTNAELGRAQECLEKVYDALCNVYPRWQNQPISMNDFPRPWQ